MPPDLERAYADAIRDCIPRVLESLELDWREANHRILLGSLAILKGNLKLGITILDFDSELTCPHCDKAFPLPAGFH